MKMRILKNEQRMLRYICDFTILLPVILISYIFRFIIISKEFDKSLVIYLSIVSTIYLFFIDMTIKRALLRMHNDYKIISNEPTALIISKDIKSTDVFGFISLDSIKLGKTRIDNLYVLSTDYSISNEEFDALFGYMNKCKIKVNTKSNGIVKLNARKIYINDDIVYILIININDYENYIL